MRITREEIKYIQDRLASMISGKYPRWSLKDTAIVSRLTIIVDHHAVAQIDEPKGEKEITPTSTG